MIGPTTQPRPRMWKSPVSTHCNKILGIRRLEATVRNPGNLQKKVFARHIMTGTSNEASDLLISHWQKGTTLPVLPESLRPYDNASGYEIQRHVLRLTKHPLFGWKIAATSAAGQNHINVSRPLAGRILRERVTELGAPVPRMHISEIHTSTSHETC